MWKIIGVSVLSVVALAAPAVSKAVSDGRKRWEKSVREDAVEQLSTDELLGLYAHRVQAEREAATRNAAVIKIYEAAHAATHKK